MSADEFQFHATAVYASGGMLLSGDDLTRLPADRLAVLKKLLPPTRAAADFDDDTLRVGVASRHGARMLKAANQYLSEQPVTITASHSPRSATRRTTTARAG